jgi:uncharacterized protein YjiS (DUF1127 family)
VIHSRRLRLYIHRNDAACSANPPSAPAATKTQISRIRLVEAQMSMIFNQSAALRGMARSDALWVARMVRRCWEALLTWQLEHTAAAQLLSMSDRELRDIGLSRSEIERAVKGELPRGRLVRL